MKTNASIRFHESILTRLTAMNAILFLAISGIIAIAFYSFRNIEQGMSAVIDTEVSEVIANAKLGRELSVIFADTNLLIGTFLEKDDFLQREEKRLLTGFEQRLAAVSQTQGKLPAALQEYDRALNALLQQCAAVNSALKDIRTTNQAMTQIFDALDNTLAERMLEGDEGELATLEHLGAMVPGYREIAFQIIILMDTLAKSHMGVEESQHDAKQALDLLAELTANLEVLSISGRHFVTFGQRLAEVVQRYGTQITRFEQALTVFQQHLRQLHTDQEQVNAAMGEIDTATATSTANIQRDLAGSIHSSSTLITISAGIIFVVLLMTGYFSLRMIRPIKDLADAAAQLARGNLDKAIQPARTRDEISQLQRTMGHMMHTIQAVLNETNTLIHAVRDGKLDVRGRSGSFEGSWRELIEGVNHVIDEVAAPINVTATCLDRLAKGDIPQVIEAEYRGDFNAMKNNLNSLIDASSKTVRVAEAIAGGNLSVDIAERSEGDRLMQAMNRMIRRLNAILTTTNDMIRAVQKGELHSRGDSAGFEGSWRDLIDGVNGLIEAFMRPLTVTAEYLDRLAKGDIPSPILDPYHGDFNTMKNNLNALIDAMEHTARIAETIASGANTENVSERSDSDRMMRALNRLIDATNATTRVAEEIAKGNLSIEVRERSERDRMMQALNAMILSLKEVSAVAEAISKGNLTVEITARSEQDTLMRSLETMVETLNRIVVDVKTAASSVAANSSDISTVAEQMSEGTSQQAAAAEQVSSSMQEMTANIRQSSDNAKVAEHIALDSASDAKSGGEAVTKTIEAMKAIAERISVIQEIAMQTHLLSLNATIEAAKAQDYGKGFAVVASEVRNLASRSREAAEEIDQLVKTCVNVSMEAGQILQRLVPNSKKTAELVQEINSAGSEQAFGAEHINTAIQQLDQVIQQNASTSEEMASASETLAAQAKQLEQAIAFFTVREREMTQSAKADDATLSKLRALLSAQSGDEQALLSLVKTIFAAMPQEKEPKTPLQQVLHQNHDRRRLENIGERTVKDELDNEFERF